MKRLNREGLGLLLLWLSLSLAPIFMRPLWEPDEARYAEIPREMLALHDALTPHLNQVAYFEKPPLQYWIGALGMKLFGLHPWVARLPLVVAGLVSLLCAWKLARRVQAERPLMASCMAGTALLGFICGQILTLDALFTAFILLALTACIEAVSERQAGGQGLGWTLGAFGSLALAVLTKGLAAPALLGGILLASLGFSGRDPNLRRDILRVLFHPGGWALFLLLACPWFIAVERANPGHARFFFIHEHLARFSTDVAQRAGSRNPILDKLYFPAILLAGLAPWLQACLGGWKRAWALVKDSRGEAPLRGWVHAALLLAVGVPLLFFTLSHSKLPPYILPALVPSCVLACASIRNEAWPSRLRSAGLEVLVLGILICAGVPFAFKGVRTWPWALPLGVSFMGLWAWSRWGSPWIRAWPAGWAAGLLLVVLGAQAAAGPRKGLGDLVRLAPAEAQWISCGQYYQILPFETRRRVAVVAGTGELAHGRDRLPQGERERWFQEDLGQLLPLARRMEAEAPGRPVWVLMKESCWKALPPGERQAWDRVRQRGGTRVLRLRRQGEGPVGGLSPAGQPGLVP